jgi:predicted CoA-binding protein
MSEECDVLLRDIGLAVDFHFDNATVDVRIKLDRNPGLLASIGAREHEAERTSLAGIMAPASVAVVGASRSPSGIGHKVLRNLLDGGFPGTIYPVNPKASDVAGVTAYPDMAAVPGPVDLAVIAVPSPAVLGVARDCAAAGVKGLVVLSAGFAENGERHAERELLAICRAAGMRLIGPNCLGIVNTSARLNASFLPWHPPPAGSRCCRSRARSGRRCWIAWPSPPSSRSATKPTSAATTCSNSGRTTRPPT